MEIIFKETALEDRDYFKASGNKIIQKRISELIEDIVEHPYFGKGKPEPLKYELSGCWSRRITDEHRIVYKVANDNLYIISLKGHY